eukprot:1151-Heterococcus_DN1.PRE.2
MSTSRVLLQECADVQPDSVQAAVLCASNTPLRNTHVRRCFFEFAAAAQDYRWLKQAHTNSACCVCNSSPYDQ